MELSRLGVRGDCYLSAFLLERFTTWPLVQSGTQRAPNHGCDFREHEDTSVDVYALPSRPVIVRGPLAYQLPLGGRHPRVQPLARQPSKAIHDQHAEDRRLLEGSSDVHALTKDFNSSAPRAIALLFR